MPVENEPKLHVSNKSPHCVALVEFGNIKPTLKDGPPNLLREIVPRRWKLTKLGDGFCDHGLQCEVVHGVSLQNLAADSVKRRDVKAVLFIILPSDTAAAGL